MKTVPASGRGDLHANQAWVEAHRTEYANEWVALRDGKLVSSAPSRGALHQQIVSRDDARDLLVVFVAGSHAAMPAQKEVWVAVDVNGIPSGAVYATKGSAEVTAAALGQSVPQYGPYRVQQYVTQETLDFSQSWYAARWERLDQLVREEATEEFKSRWFNVMANGTADVHEPPTYAGLLNRHRFATEKAQEEVVALKKANTIQHENFAAACAALGIIPEGELHDSFTLREWCEKHAKESTGNRSP